MSVLRRRTSFASAALRNRATVRWATLGVAAVMLATACGDRTEIRYVDPPGVHGAYKPFIETTDPRVDREGHHVVPAAVAIGPEAAGHQLDPIVPIASSHSRWVLADGHRTKPLKLFYFSFEDHPIQTSPRSSPVPVSTARTAASVAGAGVTVAGDGRSPADAPNTGRSQTPPEPPRLAAAREGQPSTQPENTQPSAPSEGRSAAQPEATKPPVAMEGRPASSAADAANAPTPNPTMPARYNLGPSLGTPVPSDKPALSVPVGGEEPLTISGAIDKVTGRGVLVRGATGSQQVLLPDTVRLERESRGQVSDLRPGDIVGVTRLPGGPALSVRVYSQGQGMPRPGIVPLTGLRLGQIAVYGRIVAFQGGGMLVNTGAETTPIPMAGNVEVLKPATASLSDLAVGVSLTATGNIGPDGVLLATAARLTSEALPPR